MCMLMGVCVLHGRPFLLPVGTPAHPMIRADCCSLERYRPRSRNFEMGDNMSQIQEGDVPMQCHANVMDRAVFNAISRMKTRIRASSFDRRAVFSSTLRLPVDDTLDRRLLHDATSGIFLILQAQKKKKELKSHFGRIHS